MKIFTDFLKVLGNTIDFINGKGPCLSALSFLTTFPGCIYAILTLIHLHLTDKLDLLKQLYMTFSNLFLEVNHILIFLNRGFWVGQGR